ncbi:hypothetical protein HaLaN_00232 [Haematococcus lacustris]|uniref:Uncharacterized protein n=1 Tax=Haematococcus lacustris TaxID=44745 RepID=A0A699Y8Q4_HAELA|nr:hypothetical protein HaLaN_00232 [Haematococcus lacustris]
MVIQIGDDLIWTVSPPYQITARIRSVEAEGHRQAKAGPDKEIENVSLASRKATTGLEGWMEVRSPQHGVESMPAQASADTPQLLTTDCSSGGVGRPSWG